MRLNDLISMALKNLFSRKLRTFLTVLGVVIGATSIIVMLSLGFGLQQTQENFLKSMGDLTTLDIRNNMYSGDNNSNSKEKKLNDSAISEIKEINHVSATMPIMETNGKLISGRYSNDWTRIIGITPDSMEAFGFKIEEGRLLNSGDKNGVIFGGGITQNFRDPKRPGIDASTKIKPMKSKIDIQLGDSYEMDQDQNIKPYVERIKVLGVLVNNDNDWENNSSVFMSMEYLKKLKKLSNAALPADKREKDSNEYSTIKVKVDDMENVKDVQTKIKNLGYEASGMTDWLESSKQTARIFQAIFGGIGAIAFLVAAIGITNTMIMSIYERTREIGVMKVIGASISDIEKLFLVEAGFIGFFGGIVGVIFSLLISFVFNFFASSWLLSSMMGGGADPSIEAKISVIPIWLIIIALLFSTFIGVLSGYLPAKRAMKLSALDAIKSE